MVNNDNMKIKTTYEPTHKDSKFLAPVHYLIHEGKEYNISQVVESIYSKKLIDRDVYKKLKDKRASVNMIAITIAPFLSNLQG